MLLKKRRGSLPKSRMAALVSLPSRRSLKFCSTALGAREPFSVSRPLDSAVSTKSSMAALSMSLSVAPPHKPLSNGMLVLEHSAAYPHFDEAGIHFADVFKLIQD